MADIVLLLQTVGVVVAASTADASRKGGELAVKSIKMALLLFPIIATELQPPQPTTKNDEADRRRPLLLSFVCPIACWRARSHACVRV
jgi:hypothetical protein